jgi:hypothetical protein
MPVVAGRCAAAAVAFPASPWWWGGDGCCNCEMGDDVPDACESSRPQESVPLSAERDAGDDGGWLPEKESTDTSTARPSSTGSWSTEAAVGASAP